MTDIPLTERRSQRDKHSSIFLRFFFLPLGTQWQRTAILSGHLNCRVSPCTWDWTHILCVPRLVYYPLGHHGICFCAAGYKEYSSTYLSLRCGSQGYSDKHFPPVRCRVQFPVPDVLFLNIFVCPDFFHTLNQPPTMWPFTHSQPTSQSIDR